MSAVCSFAPDAALTPAPVQLLTRSEFACAPLISSKSHVLEPSSSGGFGHAQIPGGHADFTPAVANQADGPRRTLARVWMVRLARLARVGLLLVSPAPRGPLSIGPGEFHAGAT